MVSDSMATPISYVDAPNVSPAQLAELYNASGINRPTADLPRLAKMLEHANLVIAAYAGDRLVGIARALSDFSYCCYLSDLAVARDFQRQGIGRELIRRVKLRAGEQSMLLLLSAPTAMAYYPKIGMEKVENGWIIKRPN